MNAVTAPEAASNPFGSTSVAAREGAAMVAVEQSRAVAETQAALIMAKRFPRDPMAAMNRILNACTRPTLAEQSLYTYSRGGTDITGPSIRLAEALAQNWGNIQFGIRELDQRAGESTVEAFAWDVETNTRQVKVFQVKHERHTRQGAKALTDPRDIYELTANQGARRLRACILGVIPGDVVEEATKQCEITLNTKAEVTPERIEKLLEAFAAYGVTREQIVKRIQRNLDAMTPAQLVQMGKIYNSLKDGMSSPAEWFEAVAPAEADAGGKSSGASTIRDAAKKAAAGKKAEEPPPPAGSAEPAPVADGLAEDAEVAKLIASIEKTKDQDVADIGLDAARSLSAAGFAKVKAAYDAKFAGGEG